MAKRKARKYWIWHEFKEVFVCCGGKPRENYIDIIAQNASGRESRLSTMTGGSTESTTTLREAVAIGKSHFSHIAYPISKERQFNVITELIRHFSVETMLSKQ